MIWRKRGEDSIAPPLLFRSFEEIKPLLRAYGSMKSEPLPSPLIQVVKRALGELFSLHSHFTFEEFINHLGELEAQAEDLKSQIEGLVKKKGDLAGVRMGRKEYKEEAQKLGSQIDSLMEAYRLLLYITRRMREMNLKPALCQFCDELSTLQFSEKAVSSKEITKLIRKFLWFLMVLSPHEHKPEWTTIIRSKMASFSSPLTQSSIQELIEKAHRALKSGRIQEMEVSYHELLKAYEEAAPPLKNRIYQEIFTLWFQISLRT